MLIKLRTEYGIIANMIEHRAWNEGKTNYALTFIKSLYEHIAQLDAELSSHVEKKYSEKPR